MVEKPAGTSGSVQQGSGAESGTRHRKSAPVRAAEAPYARAENEDDDGYDPWSDRPARPEPLFEEDPWR